MSLPALMLEESLVIASAYALIGWAPTGTIELLVLLWVRFPGLRCFSLLPPRFSLLLPASPCFSLLLPAGIGMFLCVHFGMSTLIIRTIALLRALSTIRWFLKLFERDPLPAGSLNMSIYWQFVLPGYLALQYLRYEEKTKTPIIPNEETRLNACCA